MNILESFDITMTGEYVEVPEAFSRVILLITFSCVIDSFRTDSSFLAFAYLIQGFLCFLIK